MRVFSTLIVTAAFSAVAAPAFATGVIHNANTEIGYTTHPEHAQSGKSRVEVVADLEQARSGANWQSYRLGVGSTAKTGTPLTRAEVEAQLLRAQKHPTWNARRVGAPVSMD